MKKLILILFSLLLYLGSIAQPYKSCLDGEMTRWSFLGQPECAGHFYVASTEIVAYGDVLINDVRYKKLYLDWSFDSYNAEVSNANWKNHHPQLYYEWEGFFVRESEDASKLYIYSSYWNKEYLISDMNLQEGETFQLYCYYTNVCDAIVDEVYLKDDLKHIRWHFTGCGWYTAAYTFIESVGSNMWFIYPGGCNVDTWGLNCFQNQMNFYKNNGVTNHWDFADSPCGYYYAGSGTNSILQDNYHIFIQKDKIEMLFVSEVNVDISVYDMQGKLCYMKNNVFDKHIEIPTSSFSKGVYILRMFDKNTNKLYTSKIIL